MDETRVPEEEATASLPARPSEPVAREAVPAPERARRRVRLVIESVLAPQFEAMTDAQLIAIAVDATRTVRGTINVTRADLTVDGRALEVYREP